MMKASNERLNQILFDQSVEMAKHEVARNVWHNLNVERMRLLITFCMEYLRGHADFGTPPDENDEYLEYYN